MARATFARLTPAALSGEWPGGAAAEAEGAIFSSDGQFVFISNSAELGMPDKGLHWTHKGGYISKLAVQPDGSLNTINEKLITGLTGPLGMPVIPVATEKFPAGTIFVIEAWAPLAEADTVWHVATVAVRQAGRFALIRDPLRHQTTIGRERCACADAESGSPFESVKAELL